MKYRQPIMRPQDIVILLKIVCYGNKSWNQLQMSEELFISQSEISQSIARSKYAGLLDDTGKNVRRLGLMEFIQYGIPYVFPQKPGAVVRGIPTAHSAPPLNKIIHSAENYVWPTGKGSLRGHSIIPLYQPVTKTILNDSLLYEFLALVDAIRVGRAREKTIAINELKKSLLNG